MWLHIDGLPKLYTRTCHTIHYINENFQRKDVKLDVQDFNENHNSYNIKMKMK